MPRIKIEVTQEDIEKGKPRKSSHCPIARAIKQQCRNGTSVQVSEDGISIEHNSRYGYASDHPPTRAVRFIERFDRGRPVKPFKFFHEIPSWVQR